MNKTLPLDGRKIPFHNGIQGKTANTRPAENRFCQDCSGHIAAEIQTYNGDQRNDKITESMLKNYYRFRQTLGPGSGDVIFIHGIQHKCPCKTCDHCK